MDRVRKGDRDWSMTKGNMIWQMRLRKLSDLFPAIVIFTTKIINTIATFINNKAY